MGRHAALAPLAIAALLVAGCAAPAEAPHRTLIPRGVHGVDQSPSDDLTFTDCLAGLAGLDLNLATIPELQAAMSDGRITSLRLVDAYLARIHAFDMGNMKLQSIRDLNPTARDQARILDAERAAGHVRSPMHGIPILLKDNINTFDEPTTAGSIALAKNVPPKDADLVRRLRDAGAVILGKTNMDEFADGMSSKQPAGYSSLGGQVHNAYTGGSPRGSSSGSGVAASMAFAAVTMGTHTSGSIVLPSSANSLAGLRGTTGFVSRAGVIPLSPSWDTVGPMGRNVADLAAVMDAVAGTDPRDPRSAASDAHRPSGGFAGALRADALQGARIGYDPQATTDDERFARALEILRTAGATLVEVTAPPVNAGPEAPYGYNEFKFALNDYLAHDAGPGLPVHDMTDIILYNQEHQDQIKYGQDELVKADATPGRAEIIDPAQQPQALASHAELDPIYADNRLDAVVDPSVYFEGPGDFVGYPTLVVPLAYAGNAPIPLFFNGQAWSDAKLLSYGYAFEQATHARVPPTVMNEAVTVGVCH